MKGICSILGLLIITSTAFSVTANAATCVADTSENRSDYHNKFGFGEQEFKVWQATCDGLKKTADHLQLALRDIGDTTMVINEISPETHLQQFIPNKTYASLLVTTIASHLRGQSVQGCLRPIPNELPLSPDYVIANDKAMVVFDTVWFNICE